MSQKILEAVKTRLYATTTLTTAISSRIFLDAAPANSALPLMVYRTTQNSAQPLFGGVERYEMTFEFLIFYNNTGDQAIHTVASALATALSTPISIASFGRVVMHRIEGGVPSYGDDAWTMTERYKAVAFKV